MEFALRPCNKCLKSFLSYLKEIINSVKIKVKVDYNPCYGRIIQTELYLQDISASHDKPGVEKSSKKRDRKSKDFSKTVIKEGGKKDSEKTTVVEENKTLGKESKTETVEQEGVAPEGKLGVEEPMAVEEGVSSEGKTGQKDDKDKSETKSQNELPAVVNEAMDTDSSSCSVDDIINSVAAGGGVISVSTTTVGISFS